MWELVQGPADSPLTWHLSSGQALFLHLRTWAGLGWAGLG